MPAIVRSTQTAQNAAADLRRVIMTDGADEATPRTPADEHASAPTHSKSQRTRTATAIRPFPRRSIEESLAVPAALRDNNGGNAWATDNVAQALGMAKTNTKFFYLANSSRAYGFTEGGRDTAEISLTGRGKSAMYPKTAEERDEALRAAFFSVEIFAQVVNFYNGSKLPDEPFRTNALTTTFNLDESHVKEFVEVFDKNCRFLGIGNDYGATGATPAQSGTRSGSEGSQTVAVPPKKATSSGSAPVCFVAMPFTERDETHPIGFFTEVLESLFTPAIIAAGFEARTAKRQGSDVIQSTIINELLDADLVLADLTEHNPNVLFELGMRMNADKPVALVRAKGTGAIFDVDHMLRVEDYNPNLWKSTVERDIEVLSAHIKAAWENRASTQTYMKLLKSSSTS
jgi:hypothetical protein